MTLQGAKASAAAVPAAPAYSSEEFKHELVAPVQQLLRDSLDQVASAMQTEEQSVAGCLQHRLMQAQEKMHSHSEPKDAIQESWDVFALLRSEARLSLTNETGKIKGHGNASAWK